MVTEKEKEKTEETEEAGDELDSLKQENESLARELESRDTTIMRLEQALAAKDSEIVTLKQSLDEAKRTLDELGKALPQAVAAYRELVVQANPGVLAELITGDSIEEVNESLKNARALMERVRQELGDTAGRLTVELRNDDGRYASPGEGDLAVLDTGCHLEFGPGYVTASGNEYSSGQNFCLESYEHTSYGGKASLILHARDGWGTLEDWKARHQFRWNRTSDDFSIKEIIALILARAGIKLEVASQSSVITGFYPDFTVSPDNNGRGALQKLLSFVPDVLFIEGNRAYIVNPLSSDSSVYSYGGEHRIHEGRYLRGAMKVNRVQVEGYDTVGGSMVLAESFDWDEIDRLCDRLDQVEDRNVGTVAEAQQRGQACLRQAEMGAGGGMIVVPVNCGQQLYDVIDVTDTRAGLDAEKKRVLGLVLVYNPRQGEYRQRLTLGTV